MGAAALVLAALVALAVWLVSLYVHPFTTCSRCYGKRLNRGSTGKRFGMCKRCGGSGRQQRRGSKTLHRWIQSVMTEIGREKARRLEQAVKERTRNPHDMGGPR